MNVSHRHHTGAASHLLAAGLVALGWITWGSVAASEPPPPAKDLSDKPTILGTAADIRPLTAGNNERHWADPGTRLYSRADPSSAVLATIDVAVELEILARHGHWIEVRYASWKGWIATRDAAEAEVADPGFDPELDAWRLELAREILNQGTAATSQTPRQLGSFNVLTDVENRRLLRFLADIASHLPAAYSDRFGIELIPGSAETIILFSREEDYRVYESRVRPETDRGTLGHADQGLAVLYVGRQGADDVAAVLVHELTHVLNRRHLRESLPPWLEEGMAHDLAFCRIDGLGQLELATLGGRSVVVEEHFYQPGGFMDFDRSIHVSGPRASWSLLRKHWREGNAHSLERLTDLISREFFDPEDRPLRYDASTFLIRYLIDGQGGELADSFRSYLAALAAGDSEQTPNLLSFLAKDWSELEQGFTTWLQQGG